MTQRLLILITFILSSPLVPVANACPTFDQVVLQQDEEDWENADQLYDSKRKGGGLTPFRKSQSAPKNYSLDCSDLAFPTVGKVISPFGYRGKRMHSGSDIKLRHGDSVVSVAPGVVIFARNYGGYGNVVVVRHNTIFETFYSHLSKMVVKEGQKVKKGTVVGLGGRSGRATTDHLHFEVRLAGKAVNPEIIYDFSKKVVRTNLFEYNMNGCGRLIAADNQAYRPSRCVADTTPTEKIKAPKEHKELAHADQSAKKRKESTPAKTTAQSKAKTKKYTIRKGDTLGGIAQRHGVTVKQLRAVNTLSKNGLIREGKTLLIPVR